MRMNKLVFLALGVALFGLFGCGGGPDANTVVDDAGVPDWFLSPPEDPNYWYQPATGQSKDLQTAIDKAMSSARGELATRTEAQVTRLYKDFTEEVGTAEASNLRQLYTDVTEGIADQALHGSRAAKTHYVREGVTYRAFVLAEMPIGAAEEELLSRLSREEELYTEFKATKAFDELEDRVEEYRQFKKERSGY